MLMTSEILYYSFLVSFATGFGSLLAYLFPISRQMVSFSFGFSSGIMLYLSYFSMLPTAVKYGGLVSVFMGILCAVLMMGLFLRIPGGKNPTGCTNLHLDRVGFYFILAVIAHHIPEGIAIGVGYEAEHHMGILLVVALAIHNLPEGMALAMPLISAGRSPLYVMAWSLICGMTLPLGTWLGIAWLNHSLFVMSISLSFAAGTMIWIIIREVFPQAYRFHRFFSWFGFIMGGIVIYMVHS